MKVSEPTIYHSTKIDVLSPEKPKLRSQPKGYGAKNFLLSEKLLTPFLFKKSPSVLFQYKKKFFVTIPLPRSGRPAML